MDAADLAIVKEALEHNARQRLTAELDDDELEHGDFEGAYDRLIESSREALEALRRIIAAAPH